MGPGPDIAIVGGGIIGAAAAAFLAEAGVRVLLVERDDVAAGASGRNSGVVQRPFDPVLEALYLASLTLYRQLAATADDFVMQAEPAGLLYVSTDTAAARRLASALSDRPELSAEYLAPGDASRREPAVAADVAACRLAIGYPVAPAAATLAYARRARRAGAVIETGSAVALRLAGGRVAGLRVGDREVSADAVVVAAGPSTPDVLDRSRHSIPIVPMWGVVVDVAFPGRPSHVLEELEVEATIEPRNDDRAEPGGVAFSLVPAGRSSSLGSTFLPNRPEADDFVPRLVERGARFVPELAGAKIGPTRVCARPQSADGRPLIGRVPGLPGAYVAAGHGPWGISTGPASARLVADLILGHRDRPPAALDPTRFRSAARR